MFQLMVLLSNTDDTFVTTLTLLSLAVFQKIFQADDEENDDDDDEGGGRGGQGGAAAAEQGQVGRGYVRET